MQAVDRGWGGAVRGLWGGLFWAGLFSLLLEPADAGGAALQHAALRPGAGLGPCRDAGAVEPGRDHGAVRHGRAGLGADLPLVADRRRLRDPAVPGRGRGRLPQGQCGPGGARPGQPAPGAGRAGGHRPLRCALAASGAGDRLGPAPRPRGLCRRQCGAAGPPGRAQRPRHQAGLARGGAGAAPGDRARRGDAAPARGGHRPWHAGDAHRPAGAAWAVRRWPAPRPLPSAAAGSAASPASSASWSRAG